MKSPDVYKQSLKIAKAAFSTYKHASPKSLFMAASIMVCTIIIQAEHANDKKHIDTLLKEFVAMTKDVLSVMAKNIN